MQPLVTATSQRTTSILSITNKNLALATSGAITLHQIAQQLTRMFELCVNFTAEMWVAMTSLILSIRSLHEILRQVELALPLQIHLPIIRLPDALGHTMSLPYQLCQQWSTFNGLLGVICIYKPGQARVGKGLYSIMQAQGGRLLEESTWQHSIITRLSSIYGYSYRETRS